MDVFFISFKEHNCEENWIRLLEFHPTAKRLHGIKGIDRIHLLCDQLSQTEFFWTVDGDNWLVEQLNYAEQITTDLVMFKAIDPIHETLTLLGGAKLWRKGSIIGRDMSKGDFSLNATATKQVIEKAFSYTNYNASPYDSWKTAFRHCVKLMSVIFQSRPGAKNLDSYIAQWAACKDSTALYADWAYQGFMDATIYVGLYGDNLEDLHKINNYDWLDNYFREKHGALKRD